MELTDRVARITHIPGAGLLAADVTGRIHLLDEELRLLRSSPAPTGTILAGHAPVYTIAAAGDWIVGKDKLGTLLRWRLDTLDLVDVLDAHYTCDRSLLMENEEPSPQMSRGILVHEGRVYVNNGYRQVVVLDLETFEVERIEPSFADDVAMEWLCTDHPEVDVVSDKSGRIFLGDLAALDFPNVVKVDGGNIHRICYDPLHDRFWATQDDGVDENDCIANGVLTLDARGKVLDQLLLARDDVEFLAFSPDHRTVYVGGFDGVLHVLDNSTPQLRVDHTVSGFTHQLTDFAVGTDGSVFTLTQDGDLRKLSADGRTLLARAAFRPQCAWDIQPSVDDPAELFVAADDGVAVVSVVADRRGEPQVRLLDHVRTGFGFTRRVVPLPGGWAGVSRDRWVWRSDRAGNVLWKHRLEALTHTLAGSAGHERLLAAANDGVTELDAATGEVLGRLDIGDASAWAACYLPTGERAVASSDGVITLFAAGTDEVLWRLETDEYPKRMWATADSLIVTGQQGVKEISLATREITGRWTELLDNTVENGALLGDRVYAVSYGVQIGVYERESGELLALAEDLPDFVKAVAAVPYGTDGAHALLAGGRGGFLSLYRIAEPAGGGTAAREAPAKDAAPLVKVRDAFLPR
ncbi:PQQ-binding-like beta-propeller repeat protein [Streptomyces sp. NPDC049577]|uniref:WD40 repeat domain-containing protein n=1 Tax=Streptomyces sp. NPDC049577 TaxID=3155153 RepID=UPI003428977F